MHDPNDIGQLLRLAREKRNETLQDVEFRTRIPAGTLGCLEQNDYSVFSAPAYAKSFLAQYSEYLEVDAHDWLASFQAGDALANLGDYAYLHVDTKRQDDGEPTPARQTASKAAPPAAPRQSFLGPFIAFVLGVGVVGGGLYAFMMLNQQHGTSTTLPVVDPDSADTKETDALAGDEPTTPPLDTAPTPAEQVVPAEPVPDVPVINDTPPPVAVPVDPNDIPAGPA